MQILTGGVWRNGHFIAYAKRFFFFTTSNCPCLPFRGSTAIEKFPKTEILRYAQNDKYDLIQAKISLGANYIRRL
jgi:hypothetical protein